MPVALTYPGVYVEEIPSGVRTITGVATSITAFVGRAARGPTNQAVTINSFGDFESIFGGLWTGNALGYAVRDFFGNGGSQAIIVRLYHADPGNPQGNPPVNAPAAKLPIAFGSFKFLAANEGRWGVNLRVAVDVNNVSPDVAMQMGVTTADLFNLTVTDTGSGRSERYLNLTMKDSPRRVDKVLAAGSSLLRYDGIPNAVPAIAAGKDPLSQKEDALAAARKALTDKQNADPAADVTAEKAAVVAAKTTLDTALGDTAKLVSDGLWLAVADFLPNNGETLKQGLYALEQADLFNLLCVPPYRSPADPIDVDPNLVSAAATYVEKRRAMLLLDAPKDWNSKSDAKTKFTDPNNDAIGTRSKNAALFFPRLHLPDPLHDNQVETFSSVGAIAGVFARTDANRGVWKAPAGLDATLNGVPQLALSLTDAENGELNPLGINCLRAFPVGGRVVWGSRTLRGADQLADDYKYIPVRRTALYMEESLYRGLQWVVFEPNDDPLWAQIRLNVGAFLHNMFRQGAFQGSSPKDAYFVKCDKETTTQNDINLGIVNVVVGFAPLKPAEFVIIKLQQIAGQIEV
jgi:phage tail sheath protein FI